MKPRTILVSTATLVAAHAACTLGACASDEPSSGATPDGSTIVESPTPDATADAPSERDDACSDCAYFPVECSDDALCPNGPFDPRDPQVGLDWRTQINTIRGRSANDVWAAGAAGTLAHFDGTSWTLSAPDTRESMHALWLRDSGEASLATLDSIYTRGLGADDGGATPSSGGWAARTPADPPDYASQLVTLTSAWAANGADALWCTTSSAWQVLESGLWRLRFSPSSGFEIQRMVPLLDCDSPPCNSQCETLGCSQLVSIHGVSADSFWAVGFGGSVVHVTNAGSDAPTVKQFNPQTIDALHGVWVNSESDAWAVGAHGTIRHYTGHPILWDIVSDVPTTEDLRAVWGSSSTDIWAVGDNAVALHYDGKSWTRVSIAGLGLRRPNLTAVWMPSPGHVWIGGEGIVLSLGGKP